MTQSRSHSLEQAARHHLLCEHFLVFIPFPEGAFYAGAAGTPSCRRMGDLRGLACEAELGVIIVSLNPSKFPGGEAEGGRGDSAGQGEYGGVGVLAHLLHQLGGGRRAKPLRPR